MRKEEKKIFNLSHFLSRAGLASRRKCAEIIRDGNIKVNGRTVKEPGTKITEEDCVEYQGKKLSAGKRYYIMLNKPRGYICTSEDSHAERKAIDLIDITGVRLFSAGRLDKESEGMLIFTNDGSYSEKLTHPRFEIQKTYIVKTDRELSNHMIDKLKKGIEDKGESLRALEISKDSHLSYRFVMQEGKKREIRRMINFCDRKTVSLKRIATGSLELENLASGKWRHLTDEELEKTLKNPS